MSNQEIGLETIETNYWLDQLESLDILMKNPHFKKVILEGYLKDKVLDSVSLLADPGIKKQGGRSDVMEDLVSASNLRYHFQMIENLGGGAKQDLEDESSPIME